MKSFFHAQTNVFQPNTHLGNDQEMYFKEKKGLIKNVVELESALRFWM